MHANRMADAGGHALSAKQELTPVPSRSSGGNHRPPLATTVVILNDSRFSHEGRQARDAGLALALVAYRVVGGYSTVNTARKDWSRYAKAEVRTGWGSCSKKHATCLTVKDKYMIHAVVGYSLLRVSIMHIT